MSTFNSSGQPSVPLPPSVTNARAVTIANLEAKLAGKTLKDLPNIPLSPKDTATPIAPPQTAAAQPKMELAPPEPEPEPVVVDAPETSSDDTSGSQQAATPAPEAQPQAAPPKTRLSRSMEIQRRAEAASRAAREAANRLRQPAQAPQAKAPEQPLAATAEVEQAKLEIARLKAQYDSAVRHLNDDPLGFAKAHGVDGANLAAYVASGADPNARAIENIRRENQRQLASLKQEYDQKLGALQDNFVASQEVTAQQNFFQFVEETKAANPEAFAALSSELVFSPKDVWDTANRILETRPDLQNNFDEDKLLEAVEAEARKDPRWTRVQALNAQTKQQQSNAVSQKNKPNVSEREEVSQPAAQVAQKPTPRPAPKRDAATGQFQTTTPMQRHKEHVDAITRRLRVLG